MAYRDPDRVNLHGVRVLVLAEDDIHSLVNCLDEDNYLIDS